MLGRAPALIELQEGRGGDQKRETIAGAQLTDGGGIERCRMEHHRAAAEHHKPEYEVTEGMKQRQDAHYPIMFIQVKNLGCSVSI